MRDSTLKWALLAPAFAIACLTLLYPLAQSFWYSLHDWNLGQSARLGPFVGVENYWRLVSDDPELLTSLRITAVFATASVTLTIVTALALALLMGTGDRFTLGVRTLLVIPFAMSPALIGISWRFLLNPEYGAADAVLKAAFPPLRGTAILSDPALAMAALVAVDVWHWAPYFMLAFIGALASVPQETLEAAQVDGASPVRAFFQVVLPQIAPVLAVAVLLKTIFSLKMLDQVVTMTNGGPGKSTSLMSHMIYETAFRWYDMGYAAAMAYLLAGSMMVLAAIYARLVMGRAA